MSFLVLATCRVNSKRVNKLENYCRLSTEALKDLPGFVSISVWRNLQDAEEHRVAYEYKDPESARHGLEALSEQGLILAELNVLSASPDVMFIAIRGHQGTSLGHAPIGAMISIKHLTCGPGLSGEALDDIAYAFEGLAMLDGYLGHLRGNDPKLDDSITSIGIWRDPAALAQAIPSHEGADLYIAKKIC